MYRTHIDGTLSHFSYSGYDEIYLGSDFIDIDANIDLEYSHD